MKLSIKEFFSKCDQIWRRNPKWKTFIFCAVCSRHSYWDLKNLLHVKSPNIATSHVVKKSVVNYDSFVLGNGILQ